MAIGRGYWVENPDIKEGLLSLAPKIAGSHIQSGFIFLVGRSVLERLVVQWLQMGLH